MRTKNMIMIKTNDNYLYRRIRAISIHIEIKISIISMKNSLPFSNPPRSLGYIF